MPPHSLIAQAKKPVKRMQRANRTTPPTSVSGSAWPSLVLAIAVTVMGGLVVHGQTSPGTARYAQEGLPPIMDAPQRPGPVGEGDTVVDVRIEGLSRVAETRVLTEIRTRKNRPLSLSVIEEDVRRMTRTGLFMDVRPTRQHVEGGWRVTYHVLERPLMQYVKFVGNDKISKKSLKKEAGIDVGDALEPWAVEEAKRHMEEFYQSKGYGSVHITVLEGSKPSDRGVIFLFNEGKKQIIFDTKFVGNEFSRDGTLDNHVKSKHGFVWLLGGEFDRKQLDDDKDSLLRYYRSFGFFHATVGCIPEPGLLPNSLTLTFVINEGPRCVVRDVKVQGNNEFSDQVLLNNFETQAGEYFDQAKIQRDIQLMKDEYGALGYAFANIEADPRLHESPGELDLFFSLDEGNKYLVGEVLPRVQGDNPHTRISTILNRTSLIPGQVFDTREARESERRLQASGLFRVDPGMGARPQIVIVPPKVDQQVAERPSGFRGQSPDPESPGSLLFCSPIDGEPIPLPSDIQPAVHYQDQSVQPPAKSHQLNWNAQRTPGTSMAGYQTPASGRFGQVQSALFESLDSRDISGEGVIRAQYADGGGIQMPPMMDSPPVYSNTAPVAPLSPPPAASLAPAPYASGGSSIAPPEYTPSYGAPAQLPPGSYSRGPAPSWDASNQEMSRSMLSGNAPGNDPMPYLNVFPTVEETPTGRFMFQAGVNSDAGLIGSFIMDEQNFDFRRFPTSFSDWDSGTFRGGGQRLRLEAVPGTQVQRYMATFQDPYLLDSNFSLSLSGYYYTRMYREWDEQRTGGRVNFGYNLTHDLSVSFGFRGEKIDVFQPIVPTPPDLTASLGESDLLGFSGKMVYDRRDHPFMPTEGHQIQFGFEQVLGTFQYPRFDAEISKYFTLRERADTSGRHTLGLSTSVAYTGADTPVYERYFAGGYSSIRGFNYRGASPQQGGVIVGGDFMFLASIEYMIPITADDSLRAVAFCDTGVVQPTIDDWSDNYRISPGLGLRIMIPAMGPAPIALDFAFPISDQPGDEREMFSFNIGFLR